MTARTSVEDSDNGRPLAPLSSEGPAPRVRGRPWCRRGVVGDHRVGVFFSGQVLRADAQRVDGRADVVQGGPYVVLVDQGLDFDERAGHLGDSYQGGERQARSNS